MIDAYKLKNRKLDKIFNNILRFFRRFAAQAVDVMSHVSPIALGGAISYLRTASRW